MSRKLGLDSQGRVVYIDHFPNQAQPKTGLGKLDALLKGGKPTVLVRRSIGGIGDMLMLTPTLKAIKKQYDANITVATDSKYLEGSLIKVLHNNPNIDNIIEWDESKPTDYATFIDLTCPCAPYEKPQEPHPTNRVDIFAKHAGIKLPLEDTRLDYFVTPQEQKWAQQWLEERKLHRKKLIVVQGNSSTTRRDMPALPLQKALSNITQRNKNIGIIAILHSKNSPDNWRLDFIHQMINFDIRNIAAIVERAEVVVAPDSAILHVAAAMKKKTLTLFGPTDPRARVNYHPEAIAIDGSYNLRCGNCWFAPCCANYACWKQIKPEMIVTPLNGLLNNTQIEYEPWYVHYGNLINNNVKHTNIVSNNLFEVL